MIRFIFFRFRFLFYFLFCLILISECSFDFVLLRGLACFVSLQNLTVLWVQNVFVAVQPFVLVVAELIPNVVQVLTVDRKIDSGFRFSAESACHYSEACFCSNFRCIVSVEFGLNQTFPDKQGDYSDLHPSVVHF